MLVSRLPILLGGIRPGDVVIFQHPLHGKLIKRVDHLEAEGSQVFVTGTSPDSIDSRTFGAIPREIVLGKVIWHIPGK